MQNETEKIIEEYISRAPKQIKNIVAFGEWRNRMNDFAQKFSLEKTKTNSLRNEIIFILIGMEPKSDFVENIKRELEIDSNMAGWIAEDVNKNIFSQVEKEIDQMWASGSADGEGEPEQSEIKSTNKIGQSFEEIILNQAKAMQPAKPADSRIMNYESGSMNGKVEPPNNLPIEKDEQRVIHNYIGDKDPYREPTN